MHIKCTLALIQVPCTKNSVSKWTRIFITSRLVSTEIASRIFCGRKRSKISQFGRKNGARIPQEEAKVPIVTLSYLRGLSPPKLASGGPGGHVDGSFWTQAIVQPIPAFGAILASGVRSRGFSNKSA